jgi:hypothetical protein
MVHVAAWASVLGTILLPLATGAAILRYRLYDAARIIERLGARLRDQVDLDTLTAEVLAGAEQTMQPTRAWLWLRSPPASTRR